VKLLNFRKKEEERKKWEKELTKGRKILREDSIMLSYAP